MRATKLCHKVSVCPDKDLLKDTLRGTLSKTEATVACFLRYYTGLDIAGLGCDFQSTCPPKILFVYHHLIERFQSL